MSSSLRPTLLLLLGLCLASLGSSSPACRVQIPPHDQVARVARFIAHQCDWASMATISSHKPVVGQPFSNVFSVSDGPHGTSSGVPYMYLTHMEVSVQDLQVSPQASLSMSLAQTHYCRQQGFDPQSPLCAHVILSGSVLQVNGTEADFAKKALFSRHPEMIDWPTDHNWFFAKFNITQVPEPPEPVLLRGPSETSSLSVFQVWVLDYFGGVKTVTPDEYFQAAPRREHH
ncbi:protein CREG1 isoform 1-T1 [Anableps anableps]